MKFLYSKVAFGELLALGNYEPGIMTLIPKAIEKELAAAGGDDVVRTWVAIDIDDANFRVDFIAQIKGEEVTIRALTWKVS